MLQSSDLSQLLTLDALLQEASVSGAARRLGLSTPAVSHALARLRERFDDELLVRTGRRMTPTPLALSLRPLVSDAIEAARQVFDAAEAFDPSTSRAEFVLAATDYVLDVLAPRLEARLRQQGPGVQLRVVPNTPEDPARLRDGDVDLLVGIYGELPPELKLKSLIDERFVCVVREGHPSVGRRLTLARYTALPHVQVAPRGQPGGYVDERLADHGLTRRVARAVPYFASALELVRTGDYVATIPARLVEDGRIEGLRVLRPPLELEPYTLSMLWHPRMDGAAGHRWLRAQVESAAAGLRGGRTARRRLSRKDPTGLAVRSRRR